MGFIIRKNCPICESSDAEELVCYSMTEQIVQDYLIRYYQNAIPHSALENAFYSLMYCRNCTSLWQSNILDDEGMEQLYEHWLDATKSLSKKQNLSLLARMGYARQCIQVAKTIGKKSNQPKVLDFGMGWGQWLLTAKAFGFETDGLETSKTRIDHAERHGLNIVIPNQIKADTYDFINAEQVFEHLSDPIAVLRQCRLWLKDNGIMRIAVPNGQSIKHKVDHRKWTMSEMATRPLEHINAFTPHSLSQMAKQNGFKVFSPPIVLPMLSFDRQNIKYFFGVLGNEILSRFGIVASTRVWLRKI
jgi:2-polyprenyl-3-methyl-5-hydroxy-6-metoxy-1,4-benzoquinol methylase